MITQTRHHVYLAHLLGIQEWVPAINKMNLMYWDATFYRQIVDNLNAFASQIGDSNVGLEWRQCSTNQYCNTLVQRVDIAPAFGTNSGQMAIQFRGAAFTGAADRSDHARQWRRTIGFRH